MTTLRIKKKTREKLGVLKKEMNASSYDELMQKMIEQVKTRISLFGTEPDLPAWERERKNVRFDRY